jgi:hypothetical protein
MTIFWGRGVTFISPSLALRVAVSLLVMGCLIVFSVSRDPESSSG